MHFTNYLRYFEACEEEFYRSVNLAFHNVQAKYGITFPRIEAHCNYRAPCRFDDPFDVEMRLREVSEKTITWDFQAIRQPDGKVAAEGYVKCTSVNAEWRAVPIPQEVVKILQQKGP